MNYAQRRRFLWLILLAGLGLIAIVANATTMVHLQFAELVQYASAIARVHCIGSESRMENGEIWTDTQFRVMNREKGTLAEIIVVRQPGGKLLGLRSRVDGSPEFRQGEEVFLFLLSRPGGKFNVVGWSQGTFRIRRNAQTGIETVTQDSAGIPAYNPESHQFETLGLRNLRAEILVERIRATLRSVNSSNPKPEAK
jgi:hypothetical protein